MDNSLLIKYLLVQVFAFASVVGENSNNGGRAWNTNNGTKVFDAIWGNTGLKNNLFPGIININTARGAFLDLIKENPLNNKVYGFIKSR